MSKLLQSIFKITLLLVLSMCAGCAASSQDEPVQLRLGVSLTPEEFASFQPALESVDQAHPNWDVELEQTPQSAFLEKMNAQLAGDTLPDVVRVQGLFSQRWIRQGAFLDISSMPQNENLALEDFYPGPLDQFRWDGRIWGIPDTATPDLVYFNKDMFDAAELEYPDTTWSFQDMRNAARQLTLDGQERSAEDPDFEANDIVQWGWNAGLTNLWQRHLVQPFGADFCANPDCTVMDFTSPQTLAAAGWWASLVHDDLAAPADPYSGEQTGIPGDPFIAGKAAMGFNGYFAVGQLNATGQFRYGITEAFLGSNGDRFTPLSTNGYVISAATDHPQEAMELIGELVAVDFLEATWAVPGHSVPARRPAAQSILNSQSIPENHAAILASMEYGSVFRPHTSSALEAYSRTADLFVQMMAGDLEVEAAMSEIETTANGVLTRDR